MQAVLIDVTVALVPDHDHEVRIRRCLGLVPDLSAGDLRVRRLADEPHALAVPLDMVANLAAEPEAVGVIIDNMSRFGRVVVVQYGKHWFVLSVLDGFNSAGGYDGQREQRT